MIVQRNTSFLVYVIMCIILTSINSLEIYNFINDTQNRLIVFNENAYNKISNEFKYIKSTCCEVTKLHKENNKNDITNFTFVKRMNDIFNESDIKVYINPNKSIQNFIKIYSINDFPNIIELQILNVCQISEKMSTNYNYTEHLINVEFISNNKKYNFQYIRQCFNSLIIEKQSKISKIFLAIVLFLMSSLITLITVFFSAKFNDLNLPEDNRNQINNKFIISWDKGILSVLILLGIVVIVSKEKSKIINTIYFALYFCFFISLYIFNSFLFKKFLKLKIIPIKTKEFFKNEKFNLKLYKCCAIIFSLIILFIWKFWKNFILLNYISFSFIFSGLSFIRVNSFLNLIFFNLIFILYDILWVFIGFSGKNYRIYALENFNQPIKLVIPNIFTTSYDHPCIFISCIDIILICILLRYTKNFDYLKSYHRNIYYKAAWIFYFIGCIITIFLFVIFNYEQIELFVIEIVIILSLLIKSLYLGEFEDFAKGKNLIGMQKAVNEIIERADRIEFDEEKRKIRSLSN